MSEESSRSRGLARWATALLAGAGIVVSWVLTDLHIQAIVGEAVGGPLCQGEVHEALDCGSALRSEHAELAGIPISLLGLAFYAAVLVSAIFDRASIRNSDQPFRPAAIAATGFGLGVVFSVYLAAVSALELGTFCPMCAGLYAVNILGLIGASVWAGRWPHRLIVDQVREPKAFLNGWTGLFAMVLGLALIAGTWVIDAEIDRRVDDQPRQAPAAQEADEEVDRLDAEAYRIPEAPAKGAGPDAPVHVVEFSSFPCPHCGRLAEVLDRLVDDHGDKVRVEYRYFPMEAQDHGHRAARAGHCAHEQGAFWEMAERLYAEAPDHGPESIREYAAGIGLDEERFEECVGSDETRRRVDGDVEDGGDVGVRGTPTIFVNGLQLQGVPPYEQLEELVLREAE